MGSFSALNYIKARHFSDHALQKHLIICVQVLLHSSYSGLSTSNLYFFDTKKHHLGVKNFKHNNNVETAVHKLFKQQQKFCQHNFRSWKSNWPRALTSWGIFWHSFLYYFLQKITAYQIKWCCVTSRGKNINAQYQKHNDNGNNQTYIMK